MTDQQSRLYSNQISQDAVQSMEIITGVAPAEYGDKSSLVVHIVTKSGLDQPKPTGSADARVRLVHEPDRSRSTSAAARTRSAISCRSAGCAPIASSIRRSSRRCTTPATSLSFFDRLDVHPSDTDTLHLNLQVGAVVVRRPEHLRRRSRSGRSTRTSTSFNVAPGYSRVIGLEDAVHGEWVRPPGPPDCTCPAPNPFADTPATVSQDRTLDELRASRPIVAYTSGAHNLKIGGTISATKLRREFHDRLHRSDVQLALRRRDGNPSATDAAGTGQCRALSPNPNFDPACGLRSDARRIAVRLQRSPRPSRSRRRTSRTTSRRATATFKLGLRVDHYDGLVHGVAGAAAPRRLVRRARAPARSCARRTGGPWRRRTTRTCCSRAASALSGLLGSGAAAAAGQSQRRSRSASQQAFGRWVVVDVGYFNKHTQNGYDFNVLFNTPIVFPVAWDHSRINGFTGRDQPGRARRLQRLRRHGAHQRDLLAARASAASC